MKKVIVSATAGRDLLEIWAHLVEESPDAADHVCNKIEKEFQRLAEFPGLGHRRHDVRVAGYRFWSVYSYIVVYRVKGGTLFVSRVVHGARNFRIVFRRRRRR